jgi:photosystem II stability/assembly factor-like uncharacterized protein
MFAVIASVSANSLYTVGGTLTGLTGTVVLQNNGQDDLSLTQDGSFTFETSLFDGAGYSVTVKTHPSNQTCTITDATGLIAGANVTNISVACGSCGNETGNGNEIIQGPNGPEGADFDQVFRSLTVHPSDPATILMGTERNGFVLSRDGGNTWKRLRNGLRHTGTNYPEIWDVAFDPTDPSIIFAATLDSPGPVTGDYPSSIAGVYKSTDGGQTWTRSNCGLYNSRINSVLIDAANPLNVLAGTEGGEATFSALLGQYFDGGIYRSTDGGGSWSKILLDENDVKNGFWRMVAYGPSGNHFMTFGLSYSDLSKNIGFIRSTDAGMTWEMFAAPLKPLLIVGFDVSQDGQVIYANERDSYEIHVSTDSGSTWDTTTPNQANGPLAVSPDDGQLVIYAGFKTIYRSTDGLATYGPVLSAPAKIDDIVFAPSDPTIVYIAATGYLLYKSTDSGASFTLLKNIRSHVLNQTNPMAPVLNLLLF